jgi:hypothetical protein
MQKPPDRISPPTLFSRAAYEWINRVSRKHKDFTSLDLSLEEKSALSSWTETEFVYSTLRLDKVDVSREKVAHLAARPTSLTGLTEDELTITTMLEALRTVESLVASFGRTADLAPDVLIRLHNPLGTTEGFRETAGDSSRLFKPTPAAHLPGAVEGACRWFAADSFRELNPIEQAAVAYLRLVEFQPFKQSSDRTSLAAASLFTLRQGLPPIIIRPEMEQQYQAAMNEGLRMNTTPMVELMAGAVEKALDEMIGLIEAKRRKTKVKKQK